MCDSDNFAYIMERKSDEHKKTVEYYSSELKNKGKNKGKGIFFERGWKEKVYYFQISFFITFLTGKFLYIYVEYVIHFLQMPVQFSQFFLLSFFLKTAFLFKHVFWNILHFSILCLHWKLLTSISGSFSWDDLARQCSESYVKYKRTRSYCLCWQNFRLSFFHWCIGFTVKPDVFRAEFSYIWSSVLYYVLIIVLLWVSNLKNIRSY